MAARRIATPLAVLALLASLLCGSAHAVPPPPPLITNGGFESSTLSPWSAYGGVVTLADQSYWTAASGQQSVALNDYGAVAQDVSTTAGNRYDLSFAYAGDPGCTQGVKHLTVTWNGTLMGAGAGSATYTFDTTGHTTTSMGWQTAHLLVDAASASTHLVFTDTIDSGCGIVIDDVAMTAASGTLTGTQLTAPTASTVVGEDKTLTATVLSASAATTPTGSVQFQLDGSPLGSPVSLTGGQAQTTISDLAPGTYRFSAAYTPDSASFAASAVTQPFSVGQASTVTDLSVDAPQAPLGQDVTLTASVAVVAPGDAPLTGTVQFSDEYGPLGDPVPIGSDGIAQIAVQEDVGTHYMYATYSGNGSLVWSYGSAGLDVYDPNPPPTTETAKVRTTTSLVSSKNPVAQGESYTVTATVSPYTASDAVLDGTITFTVNAVAFGDPMPLDGAHSASITVTAPAAGASQTIRASYGGNASFYSSLRSIRVTTTTPAITPTATPPKRTPPDVQAPVFTVGVNATPLARALRAGIRTHVACNENCSARLRLTLTGRQARALGMKVRAKTITVARGSYDFMDRRTSKIVLRFSARYRRGLAKARRLSLRLTTTARDLTGNRSVHAQTVTLKR
jgi:hypothetical protein